jgi:hypothetical protein
VAGWEFRTALDAPGDGGHFGANFGVWLWILWQWRWVLWRWVFLRKIENFAVWEPLRVRGSGWVVVSHGVGCAGRRRSFWC